MNLLLKALVNMAYCLLGLLGKLTQLVVFGPLRVSEEQHLKDKFWNFVFYKFIFIFGILNLQHMEQVLAWVAWFSFLGFLHLMTTLSKDRFQYLSFSPTLPAGAHGRLVVLLTLVLLACALCLGVCVLCGVRFGVHAFMLMVAEVALVALNAAYVLVRYGAPLRQQVTPPPPASSPTTAAATNAATSCGSGQDDETVFGADAPFVASDAGAVAAAAAADVCPVYYTELAFELATLAIDFLHHLHMLVWTNTMLSMASLVISMQLRWAFNEIRRRLLKHRNYLRVLRHMAKCYPMASSAELSAASENCAICWELMLSARRLPCGHLFHNTCLRSWLEQDTSCPTCRLQLQALSDTPASQTTSSLFGAHDSGSFHTAAVSYGRPRGPFWAWITPFRAHRREPAATAEDRLAFLSVVHQVQRERAIRNRFATGNNSNRSSPSSTAEEEDHVPLYRPYGDPAGNHRNEFGGSTSMADRVTSQAAGRRPMTIMTTTNHVFTFHGSQYLSWLPSVSLEVSHHSPAPPPAAPASGLRETSNSKASTSSLTGRAHVPDLVTPNRKTPPFFVQGDHSSGSEPASTGEGWKRVSERSQPTGRSPGTWRSLGERDEWTGRHSQLQARRAAAVSCDGSYPPHSREQLAAAPRVSGWPTIRLANCLPTGPAPPPFVRRLTFEERKKALLDASRRKFLQRTSQVEEGQPRSLEVHDSEQPEEF